MQFVSQYSAALSFSDDELEAFVEFLHVLEGEETTPVLTRYLNFGAGAVERQTRRIVKKRSFSLTFVADSDDAFPLPVYPVRTLTSVTLDGETVSGASLTPTAGGWQVTLSAPVTGVVIITVDAGYDDDFPAPPELTAAVFAIAADLYEHRETQSERTLTENKTVRALIARLTMPEL